jgi:hypothetical protein
MAMNELRTLLQRFANGKDMNIPFDAVNALIDDTRGDPELGNWFGQVDSFVYLEFLLTSFKGPSGASIRY